MQRERQVLSYTYLFITIYMFFIYNRIYVFVTTTAMVTLQFCTDTEQFDHVENTRQHSNGVPIHNNVYAFSIEITHDKKFLEKSPLFFIFPLTSSITVVSYIKMKGEKRTMKILGDLLACIGLLLLVSDILVSTDVTITAYIGVFMLVSGSLLSSRRQK